MFRIQVQTDKKTLNKEKSSVAAVAVYLSLGLHKGRLSYSRSLIPQKRTSGTSKVEFSYFLWVILVLLDPDPDIQLTKMNADLDPQHGKKVKKSHD